jgi:hypothetical protein
LGQYALAQDHLDNAIPRGGNDSSILKLASLAKAVLALDPYAPRIPDRSRRARVLRAFEQAGKRLHQCAAAKGLLLLGQASGSSTGTGGSKFRAELTRSL